MRPVLKELDLLMMPCTCRREYIINEKVRHNMDYDSESTRCKHVYSSILLLATEGILTYYATKLMNSITTTKWTTMCMHLTTCIGNRMMELSLTLILTTIYTVPMLKNFNWMISRMLNEFPAFVCHNDITQGWKNLQLHGFFPLISMIKNYGVATTDY